MINRFVFEVLRVMLAGALLLILVVQTVYLPWLSGDVARQLPAEAHMRWPILTLAILGLLCVQVVIVCTARLLTFTRTDRVFSADALRWVNGIIGGFLGGSVVCLATLVYQSFTVAGPPLWSLLLVCGILAGIGLALLMVVMRLLLVRATSFKDELDVVI